MSGTRSRRTGISDPGYMKDVAEKPRLDTLWAKPRTKEVPMMATEGLLGAAVEAWYDGAGVAEVADVGLWPRATPGADDRPWAGGTALLALTGSGDEIRPVGTWELTVLLARTTVGFCQRYVTGTKPVSSPFSDTAAKSYLATEATWPFRSARSLGTHDMAQLHFCCLSTLLSV